RCWPRLRYGWTEVTPRSAGHEAQVLFAHGPIQAEVGAPLLSCLHANARILERCGKRVAGSEAEKKEGDRGGGEGNEQRLRHAPHEKGGQRDRPPPSAFTDGRSSALAGRHPVAREPHVHRD